MRLLFRQGFFNGSGNEKGRPRRSLRRRGRPALPESGSDNRFPGAGHPRSSKPAAGNYPAACGVYCEISFRVNVLSPSIHRLLLRNILHFCVLLSLLAEIVQLYRFDACMFFPALCLSGDFPPGDTLPGV